MDRLGYHDELSYEEIHKIQIGDEETIQKIVDRTNRYICQDLMNNLPLQLEYKKAILINVKLLDGMNIVRTIDDIPIQTEMYHLPINIKDNNNIAYKNKKLKFKDRLKILFKGEI